MVERVWEGHTIMSTERDVAIDLVVEQLSNESGGGLTPYCDGVF